MSRIFYVQIIGYLTFLTAVHCEWICSNQTKVTTNGNTVTFKTYDEVTCKYKTVAVNTKSSRYYEFTVVEQAMNNYYGLSVETSEDDGKKGIYFSSFGLGDGLVTYPYISGHYLGKGDTIGFLTEESVKDLKVYMYINKHPLGMIYHLTPKPSKHLYPYIKTTWTTSVSVNELDTLPTAREMEQIPFVGEYQLSKYSVIDGTEVEFDEQWKKFTFKFIVMRPSLYLLGEKTDPTAFWVNIYSNDFNIYCSILKQNEKWSTHACSGYSGAYKHLVDKYSKISPFDMTESGKTVTIKSTVGSKVVLKKISQNPGPVTISPFAN